ncbi:MAG: hypothetical protein QOI95_616 [Acidimicrobiaceae bacterium]|jgi:Trp operon repressor
MGDNSVHDLYAVDPTEFVAARDELARQLKSAGRREEAAAVKALRRPPVPVWALNSVARDRGDAVDALLTATFEAQAAQDALLAGDGDRDALRVALARRRAALQDIVHRAIDVVEASGRPAGSQQRQLEATLNTVLASDELTELLRKGELVEVADEQPDHDLTSQLGASVTQNTTRGARPVSNLADARAAKQAAAARKELERAQGAASRAADALGKATEAAAHAASELDEAKGALLEAQADADAAHEAEQAAARAHEEAVVALQRAEAGIASGGDRD